MLLTKHQTIQNVECVIVYCLLVKISSVNSAVETRSVHALKRTKTINSMERTYYWTHCEHFPTFIDKDRNKLHNGKSDAIFFSIFLIKVENENGRKHDWIQVSDSVCCDLFDDQMLKYQTNVCLGSSTKCGLLLAVHFWKWQKQLID